MISSSHAASDSPQSYVRASILIVTFNHRQIIPVCLDALKATLGPTDEVIVVDNASSDKTAEVVASRYPWVRLVRSAQNGGYGAANNLGVTVSRADYVVFLNPDTVPQSGWLDSLLAGLSPDGGTFTTPKILLASDPRRIDTFGNEVHISGLTTCRGWDEPTGTYVHPEEVSAVSGACFAVPRRLFLQLGGFDTRMFLYFEDTELSLRARLAGCRCMAIPDARVLHDHRPGFSAAKLRYLERNRYWTLLKLYRWSTLACLTPVLVLAEGVAWAMAVRSGWQHVVAKAMAWVDLFRWLPDLGRARREASRLRTVSDRALLRLHSTRLRFAQVDQSLMTQAGERLTFAAFAGGRSLTYALGKD